MVTVISALFRDGWSPNLQAPRLIRRDLFDRLADRVDIFLQRGGPTGRKSEADKAAGIRNPSDRKFVGDPPDRGGPHPYFRAGQQCELGELIAAGELEHVVHGFFHRHQIAKTPSTWVTGAFGPVDEISAGSGKIAYRSVGS
jgi:hypothetical protein